MSTSADTLPETPLPPCPGTPNCATGGNAFEVEPRTLWLIAEHALSRVGPHTVITDEGRLHIDATFRVLMFTDDLAIRVVPHGEGSALYVRSASRSGRSDLGVNKRRIGKYSGGAGAGSGRSARGG